MVLLFFDRERKLISLPVTEVTSIDWTERWDSPGDFKIIMAPQLWGSLENAAFCYLDGLFGLIDERRLSAEEMEISGRGLEAILDDYVATEDGSMIGRVEACVRNLMQEYAGDITLDGDKAYPHLINTTYEAGSLMDIIYDALSTRGMTPVVTIDSATERLVFGIKKGAKRTMFASDAMVLSDSFGNLTDVTYTINEKDFKNYVILNYGDDNDPKQMEFDFRGIV